MSIETTETIEAIERHSNEAMKLARGMLQSREKEKTSQVICHHLRKMLAAELPEDLGSTRFYSEPYSRFSLHSASPFRSRSTAKATSRVSDNQASGRNQVLATSARMEQIVPLQESLFDVA